jgi:hypothetical protein
MRSFIAITLAGCCLATNLLAAETGALPAGKPAGVQRAQDADNTVWWLAGGLAVVAVVILADSGGNNVSAAITVAPATAVVLPTQP